MFAAFLEHLGQLGSGARQMMAGAIRDSGRAVEFRSAFPVPPDAREKLTQDPRRRLGDGIAVRFEVEPELGCGVELRAHSHRMQWNLASHLDALEASFLRQLTEGATANGQLDTDTRPAEVGAG